MLPQIKTILYACDLEGKTQEAMGLALNLSMLHQAKVIVMYALEPLGAQTSNMIANYIPEESLRQLQEESKNAIQEKLEKEIQDFIESHPHDLDGLPAQPETLLTTGIPSEAIERMANEKGADLIVMNSRTHNRFSQMIIGSTANKVIHHSRIPVLVVPIK